MKARYTPLQTASRPSRSRTQPLDASRTRSDTGGLRAAALHDRADRGGREARVALAYLMTDGAALPGGFSRLVHELRTGLLDGWITCGQAFGGELEAVTMWSGLLAAKELEAEVIVVADGPGNLGTDTTWG